MTVARRIAQWLLFATVIIAGVLIAIRAFAGPIASPIRVNSPMNAESIFALTIILLWVLRTRVSGPAPPEDEWSPNLWTLAAAVSIALIVAAAFWRAAGLYFLSDDFVQLKYALGPMYGIFTMPGGDGFYRPLTNVTLRTTGAIAGANPAIWHWVAIGFHAVNSILVFALASTFRLPRPVAWLAAALFALHASRPEAVVWIAARYDLVATLFSLLALLLFVCAWDRDGSRALILQSASIAAMLLAFLSKESSYTVPFVILLFLAWRGELRTRRSYRTLFVIFTVTALFLAWRTYILGGIGGYRAESGEPEVLAIGIVSAVKAMFLRLPAVLIFPLNWINPPSLILAALLAVYLAALLWLSRTWASRRTILFLLGLLLVLAAPALPQLLIGADLQKSRILYLPSVAFCLLLAILISRVRYRWLAAGAILAFETAALAHNLAAWDYASDKAIASCSVAAVCANSRGGKIAVLGIPWYLEGVYFFANGFPECVHLQPGVGAAKVDMLPGTASPDASQYSCILRWDESKNELIVH